MLFAWPFFVLAAGLAALYAWRYNAGGPASRRRTLIKAGSVLALAGAALFGDGPGLLLAALLFCAVGDALLAQDTDGPRGQRFLLGGMAAFFVGQALYVVLFLNQGAALFTGPGEGGVQALVFAAGAGLLFWLWPRLGDMAGPVVVYALAVAAMAALAVGLPGFALVSIGALMFYASDGVLAAELFALPADSRQRLWTRPAVWAMYWGGQALITAGFVAAPNL
jgi:uncharacterized membrane protein YhhN